MQKTIKLKNPIMINNEKVSTLTYDTNEITVELYAQADVLKKIAAGQRNVAIVPAAEFDFALHLYLGLAAVVAVNPQYDFSDLERVKGADVIALSDVGRNFIMQREESEESTSEKPSDPTPEPTTPQSQTLTDGE